MQRGAARWTTLAALGAALLAACVPVTVNINFSQDKLDQAADQIVNMARPPADAEPPASGAPAPAPKSPGTRLDRWPAGLGPREAEAQGVNIDVAQAPKTDSTELRRLTDSLNQRYGTLQQWITKGCIGEDNQGLAQPRPGQGCGGDVGKLIGEENRDRQAIVETFMKQNNIPASDVGRVRASFAKAYRDRVPGGAWIQNDKGDWARK